MNHDGEGHRKQAQAKIYRREREAPGEEGEEVKSPKRKVTRVESEETQDFVPSAISVPPKPMFRCDNWCSVGSDKEDEESYTTNVCQQCYNKKTGGFRRYTIDEVAVARGRGQEAHRGRLWKTLEKDQYIREMWEYYSCGRSKV